mmetsp:Transcript_112363/g.317855  ORF Transcript_112363/g.317855 Transcript_112363/m.317855 type:complete len:218 (-) Transcript_112363:33-686(-)
MSAQVKEAMGFSVRFPSSQTGNSIRCAAWSMRRPVIRMSFSHSDRARWKGSTLLTKSKSAESISSTSPYFASNSACVLTPLGSFHNACLPYFSCTSLAHSRVSGNRCSVSIATRLMPSSIAGKCSRISATKTLSVASHAVANTTRCPSRGRCRATSFLNASTFSCSSAVLVANAAGLCRSPFVSKAAEPRAERLNSRAGSVWAENIAPGAGGDCCRG